MEARMREKRSLEMCIELKNNWQREMHVHKVCIYEDRRGIGQWMMSIEEEAPTSECDLYVGKDSHPDVRRKKLCRSEVIYKIFTSVGPEIGIASNKNRGIRLKNR
jgi:hypothetical protein